MFSFADLHLLFKFDLKVSQKQKELDDKVRMVFSWDDQIHDAEIGQYDQKVKAAASKKVRSPFLHSEGCLLTVSPIQFIEEGKVILQTQVSKSIMCTC